VYRIDTDSLIPGDYNADGEVDGLDYDTWKENYGLTGKVNAADYIVWRNNLGASVHDLGTGSTVPEPLLLGICLQTAVILAGARLTCGRFKV
jgi:hypothetical protein